MVSCYNMHMTQETALTIMKMGYNVFLTGAPGAGKTYTLNKYIEFLNTHNINVAVTAPTGIAASHINGVTVQSFFGTGIKDDLSPWDIELLTEKKYVWDRLKDLKVLIIDEVSMLSPALFSSLDRILKTFRFSDEPFGGIQVILIGDFFQLPPVKQTGEHRFIFQTEVWGELDPHVCYLETSYRHTDDTLLNILHEIRNGEVSEESMDHFRSRYKKSPSNTSHITKLYTHNRRVDDINKKALDALDTPLYTFEARRTGQKKFAEKIFDASLVLEHLALKEGALVFFIKNNYDKGYINGTLGTIIDFTDTGLPVVETHNGAAIVADREEWKYDDHEGNTKATITQIPLRLAWAITVHKSQGMTLDAAEIDLSQAFEPGQGYVALSRITSLDGLRLMGLNDMALAIDPHVQKMDIIFKKSSQELRTHMENLDESDHRQAIDAFIDAHASTHPSKKPSKGPLAQKTSTYDETLSYIEQSYALEKIARERDLTVDTIIKHIQKLFDDGVDVPLDYLRPDDTTMKAIQSAHDRIVARNNPDDFTEDRDIRLRSLYEALDEKYTYDTLKVALFFIE